MDDVLLIEESELGYLYDIGERFEKLFDNEMRVRKALEERLIGDSDIRRKEVYRRLLSEGERHLEQLQKIKEILTAIASDEEEHISLLNSAEFVKE